MRQTPIVYSFVNGSAHCSGCVAYGPSAKFHDLACVINKVKQANANNTTTTLFAKEKNSA